VFHKKAPRRCGRITKAGCCDFLFARRILKGCAEAVPREVLAGVRIVPLTIGMRVAVSVHSSRLFSPLQLAGVTFSNRVFVSPMCQYSSEDGFSSDWHLVHLGSRAVGGAGLVMTEAAAVLPEGRITAQDLGLWKDDHIPGLKRIVEFLHSQGARAGVQLAHAGRKANMTRPWAVEQRPLTSSEGGWKNVMAPSAVRFGENFAQPIALDPAGIQTISRAFARAAERALEAGFDLVELHAAHGYLLHEFLSPLSNLRTDEYGGSLENRIRLVVEVVDAIRTVWPAELPLLVRISATDWAEGGWEIDQSVALAKVLKEHRVDLIDVSSGGLTPQQAMPIGPGYQTPFAERIRREAQIPTGAVGLITHAAQAEHILRTGQADVVLLARELLREPYWPLQAAIELGEKTSWPAQYLRAAPQGSGQREPIASTVIAETATF
jgi:2,4-dienoyl-CoA reductase-like NADH-dependent reductase (Old Yellow Enzyme family)